MTTHVLLGVTVKLYGVVAGTPPSTRKAKVVLLPVEQRSETAELLMVGGWPTASLVSSVLTVLPHNGVTVIVTLKPMLGQPLLGLLQLAASVEPAINHTQHRNKQSRVQ